MTDLILFLLIVGTIANVGQLVLTWFLMREMGEIDHNRSDWWERLEDRWEAARRLRQAVTRGRGRVGPKD